MIIGYARVSTRDQNLDFQTDELTKLGCQKIYQEKVSSGKERPQLIKMIENLRGKFGNGLEVRSIGTVIKRTNKSGRNF